MTNEEMEGKIGFILKQQESFADNLLQISYTLKDVSDRQDRLQAQQDKFQSQLEEAVGATLGLARVTGYLAKSIEGLKESQQETTAAVKELAASQAHAEARLDAMIDSQIKTDEHFKQFKDEMREFKDTVERYIREGRDGRNGHS